LDGFAFGEVRDKPLTRTGARIGDIVAVTGYIGSAACGWQILQKGLDLKDFETEERERVNKYIISPCVEPKSRVNEGSIMAKSGYVTSCTDISDGLAFSLGYMRDGYGFEIHEEKIPVRKEFDTVCDKFELDKDMLRYHIGEDFELLCTVKANKFDYLKERIPGLTAIGKVVEGNRIRLVKNDGAVKNLRPSGYNHFTQ
jgi:thiamine-monophosphate kinase